MDHAPATPGRSQAVLSSGRRLEMTPVSLCRKVAEMRKAGIYGVAACQLRRFVFSMAWPELGSEPVRTTHKHPSPCPPARLTTKSRNANQPPFPAYRSGHRLFQRPSPGKQFPSITLRLTGRHQPPFPRTPVRTTASVSCNGLHLIGNFLAVARNHDAWP
jgi:hypothetical protein